jgi:4-hydroxybenzoate polyprenyltransferase
MLDKIIPVKLNYFLDLIRFSKPTGFMLLMWPCWFALAVLPLDLSELIWWFFLFFIGSFLMRSAGCIINDLVDIDIDKKIKRTATRVLTSKKITVTESIFFLLLLLFLSLLILLQFNKYAIFFGILSFPLIILYPFMKRYIFWPQLALGLIFNWGIIIVHAQFSNEFLLINAFLYIGCIFWTLAYDTIYAYQDRIDDISNNIKSTAVLFGEKGRVYVKFFYLIFFSIIGYLSWETSSNFLSLIVIIIIIFVINTMLNKWDLESRNSSNYYFKFNNIIGLCCFLLLLIF